MSTVMKTLLYVTGLILAGMLGWYLSANHSNTDIQLNEEYVATVNGQGLAKDWFVEQMKVRGGEKPGNYQTMAQKKALLDFLIREEILYQQALEKGIGDDPAVAHLFKKAVIDKFTTDFLNAELAKVKVGDSEAESHFENNQSAYNKPARRRAAIIVAEFTDSDDEASKLKKLKRIETAKSAVAEMELVSTHFGELAKVYSDDRASMYQGGVIGWFINHPSRKYKWDQAIIDSLFALEKPGDVSDIITTESGYYLVRLAAAENVKEKAFAAVKKGIKNQLLQAKRKQVREAFLTELTGAAEVQINHELLADLPALSSPLNQNEKTPPAMPSVGGAQ